MKTVCLALSLLMTPQLASADDLVTPETAVAAWEADPMQVFDAADISLDDFVWTARPIVVFADSPNDPEFKRQIELLGRNAEELVERDVVVITDTDPAARTDARLRLRPRGFMFVLIGKDGQIKQRKPRAWNVRELSRTIDKMPMRQQEIEDRRNAAG